MPNPVFNFIKQKAIAFRNPVQPDIPVSTPPLILRYLLEVTYKDGYVHRGNQNDVSQFDRSRNAFYDVPLLKETHGAITNFAVVSTQAVDGGKGMRFDIDFTLLPEDARPVWFMERSITVSGGHFAGEHPTRYFFGYQATISGKNYQDIKELP